MRKRVCLVLAVLCLLWALPVSAGAEAAALPALDSAGAVYLYHVESGRAVGRKSETDRRAAGASVKLLSGLVACEWLGSRLDETVEITDAMLAGTGGRVFRLAAGEILSWRELLLLALCGSYNDAYDVIAYSIGNGEQVGVANYVELLNRRAKELGAGSTVAGDASGIADNSYTTAADLCLIARAAAENALYVGFAGLKSGTLSDGRTVRNRNSLIGAKNLGGADCAGMCVGETANAGVTLVTLVQKATDSYLLVLMDVRGEDGTASESAANSLAARLVQWAYRNYKNTELLPTDQTVCTLPVTVSDLVDSVDVRPREALWAYLPAGCVVGEDVLLSIRLTVDSLEAPVSEGTAVCFVAAIYDGQVIGRVPLETAGSVDRSGFMSRLLSIKNLTKSRRAKASVAFFLSCMTVWIGGALYLRYRRRAKWHQYYSSKSKWR